LPVNLMFKEFAEDVAKLLDQPVHPLIVQTRKNAEKITLHFTGKLMEEIKEVSREESHEGCAYSVVCVPNVGADLPVLEV
jgi:D-alanine-D-alanine ligase